MTAKEVASLPTLDQMLTNFLKAPKEAFENAGLSGEFPFEITAKPDVFATEIEELAYNVLVQAQSVLMQVHLVKKLIEEKDTPNAVYHAFIVARHLSDFDEAQIELNATIAVEREEAKQDSQS